jgi:NAD(P)-dependent dehydrogenase (short-subunit alcohol dehydrogenase family)
MKDLDDKVAVVTGAASGIGRALAGAFAAEGMQVMLADIDTTGLADVADDLRSRGTKVDTARTDVAVGAEIEALAAATLESFGAVHVVCNNAGIGAGGMVAGFDVEVWKRVIDVDLWSVLHGMRVFLPILTEQGEGHVVNTASVAGLFAPPFMGPYDVSKAGVVAASEAAFHELAAFAPGVGISVLCPGWVRTNIADGVLREAERAGRTEDAAMVGMVADAMRGYLEAGMDPADVAAQVVDAVKARHFYVLTHPDSRAMVRKRMEAILEGNDPPVIGPEDF